MKRRYVTVDVFTDRMFGGNQLAVVLDAQDLSTAQMQSVAAEFGYSETTFVLPAGKPGHHAQVRIFTPKSELPFAGHPNIGTAFVLARRAETAPERLMFEETAGTVALSIWREAGVVTGAELKAPAPVTRTRQVPVAGAAACLTLAPDTVRTQAHAPVVAGVGIDMAFVELATRQNLARAAPDAAAQRSCGVKEVFAYWRDGESLHARMFAPLDGIAEDPATGSAAAALVALLAELEGRDNLALRIHQGDDMGRPSLLRARAQREEAGMMGFVGGQCVPVMEGSFTLVGATW